MHKIKTMMSSLAILATLLVTQTANATVITTGYITFNQQGHNAGHFEYLIGAIPVIGYFDESSRALPGYEGFYDLSNNLRSGITEQYTMQIAGMSNYIFLKQGTSPINVTTPGLMLVRGQETYQTEFEFNGALCGRFVWNSPSPSCDIAFPELTGHGIAELSFVESVLDDGRHLFTPMRVTYTFVPEPSTFVLFVLGLVAIAFTKRRQLPRHQ